MFLPDCCTCRSYLRVLAAGIRTDKPLAFGLSCCKCAKCAATPRCRLWIISNKLFRLCWSSPGRLLEKRTVLKENYWWIASLYQGFSWKICFRWLSVTVQGLEEEFASGIAKFECSGLLLLDTDFCSKTTWSPEWLRLLRFMHLQPL